MFCQANSTGLRGAGCALDPPAFFLALLSLHSVLSKQSDIEQRLICSLDGQNFRTSSSMLLRYSIPYTATAAPWSLTLFGYSLFMPHLCLPANHCPILSILYALPVETVILTLELCDMRSPFGPSFFLSFLSLIPHPPVRFKVFVFFLSQVSLCRPFNLLDWTVNVPPEP